MQISSGTISERFVDFDPATIYEAAGHRGMVDPTIRPVWPGAKLCGPALVVDAPPGDNLALHHAVAAASAGVVIVAKLGGYLMTGAWGEILTAAAMEKGVAGLVTDGAVRDIAAITERGFPVFSRGVAIGSCTKERFGSLNVPILFGGVPVRSGDLVLADADGVVVIDQERIEEIYEASLRRRQREREIMAQLSKGKTTIEILGLPAAQDGTEKHAK